MKTHIRLKLNDLKTASGKSLEDAHAALGYATSTVHRWLKGESDPSVEQLTNLVEFFGGNMTELFAEVGQQEMIATEAIGYQGADVMVEHYEQRLKAQQEKYELLKEHHSQRIEEINDNHSRAVEYLKDEIKRLRGELDISNQAAIDLSKAATNFTGKKHVVFWVLAGANALLALLLFVALQTGPIF